jgi:uncharacterized protein DUF6429
LGYPRHVRSTPNSDRRADIPVRQLRAKLGSVPAGTACPFHPQQQTSSGYTLRFRFAPFAIFCAAEYSRLFNRPVGDGTSILTASNRRGIVDSAINIIRRSSIMDIDRDRIDEVILALLFLGRHDGMRTWKSFDWAAMERLHTKGFISDPVGKAKSVVFTDEGLRQSEALFRKLFTVGRGA